MKRAALYSSRAVPRPPASGVAAVRDARPDASAPRTAPWHALQQWASRYERVLLVLLGVLVSLATVALFGGLPVKSGSTISQEDIDAAVVHTLVTKDLPSRASRAASAILPSVVRIRRDIFTPTGPRIAEADKGMGTGVVIKEDGTILTNWHVVDGAPRLTVTFSDGMDSPAVVISKSEEKDIALIKPLNIPDDLQPATLGSSTQVTLGDEVIAVGFPFGMGPSVTSGVVSGLDRDFEPDDGPMLHGLIQFDAAVNPGNSGGPLANMAGEVLGVVTAIFNPHGDRTFIGIGFAVTMESAGVALGIPPF